MYLRSIVYWALVGTQVCSDLPANREQPGTDIVAPSLRQHIWPPMIGDMAFDKTSDLNQPSILIRCNNALIHEYHKKQQVLRHKDYPQVLIF